MGSGRRFLAPSALLVVALGSALSIRLPPSLMAGKQICTYQYAIPNNGNCVTYGPALEHKLDAVQADVDKVKLQFVSDVSVLRDEIRRLTMQSSAKDAVVADLTKDVKNLQASLTTLGSAVAKNSISISKAPTNNKPTAPSGQGSINVQLQQQLSATKQQLTGDLLKLERQLNDAVTVMQKDRQQDAIQQSKVDAAFQNQLRQQQQDLTAALRRIALLEKDVLVLQQATQPPPVVVTMKPATTRRPITRPPTTTTTTTTQKTTPFTFPPVTRDPLLVQLQAEMTQAKARMTQLEKELQQANIKTLTNNVTMLLQQSKNQSLELSNVKTLAEYIQNTEIPDIKTQLQNHQGEIAQLFKNINQDLKPLQNQVQKVAANVSSLTTQVTRLGTDSLSQKVQVKQDEVKLNDLGVQVRLLASKLSSLQANLGVTTTNPPPRTTTRFAIPTPRPKPVNG